MNRDVSPTGEPEAGIWTNGVHDTSGDGVSPVRANIERVVPSGKSALHITSPQLRDATPSNTLEVKLPEAT